MLFEVLNKPKIKSGEALTSYIQRVAYVNYLTPHEIWRVLNNSTRYPQSNMASLIDYIPSSVFDLDNFGKILGVSPDVFNSMVFRAVLLKFFPDELDGKLLDRRILSGCIDYFRKYCPICLSEQGCYSLQWQIKEIDVCLKHFVKLLHCCYRCGSKINILGTQSIVGVCEKCYCSLEDGPLKQVDKDKFIKRIYEDWCFLLDPCLDVSCGTSQITAIKLLYVMSDCKSEFTLSGVQSVLNKSTISGILQTARESRSTNCHNHVALILRILRHWNLSLEAFFNLDVPESFIDTILVKPVVDKNIYHCITPWCKSYKSVGSLERTTTSVKRDRIGGALHYYMYCNECMTEYGVDRLTGQLVERNYFIKLAWDIVKPCLDAGMSRPEIVKAKKITQDKVLRSTIYLYANGLITKDKLDINLPDEPDPSIKEQIAVNVLKSVNSKRIRTEILQLSYAEFLYYWFQKDIIALTLTRRVPRLRTQIVDSADRLECVRVALKYFLENHKKISIKEISKYVGVCPETLRLWGALSVIKDAKKSHKR